MTFEAEKGDSDLVYEPPGYWNDPEAYLTVSAAEFQFKAWLSAIESLASYKRKLVGTFLTFVSHPCIGWQMSDSEKKAVDVNRLVVLFSQSPQLSELLGRDNNRKNSKLVRLCRKLSTLLIQLNIVKKHGQNRKGKELVFNTLSELEQSYGWSRSQVKSLFLVLGQVSVINAFAQLEVEASLSALRAQYGEEFRNLYDGLVSFFDSDAKILTFLNKLTTSMQANDLFEASRATERNQIFDSFKSIIYYLERLQALYVLYEEKAKDKMYFKPQSDYLGRIELNLNTLFTSGLSQQTVIELYTMLVESNK